MLEAQEPVYEPVYEPTEVLVQEPPLETFGTVEEVVQEEYEQASAVDDDDDDDLMPFIDDIEFAPSFHSMQGRLSSVFNEDDYDYALELRHDDEYRQAAEALPEITDFQNLERVLRLGNKEYDSRVAVGNIKDILSSPQFKYKSMNKKKSTWSHIIETISSLAKASDVPLKRENSISEIQLAALEEGKKMSQRSFNDNSSKETLLNSLLSKVGPLLFKQNEENKILDTISDRNLQQDASQGASFDGAGFFLDSDNNSTSQSPAVAASQSELPIDDSAALIGEVGSNVVSKKDFMAKMGVLSKQRKWIEKAARRSSVAFQSQYFNYTDKEVMDKLLVYLVNGITIRRHQAHHTSEAVRFYSADGNRTIQWEPVQSSVLLRNTHTSPMKKSVTDEYVYSDFCMNLCTCSYTDGLDVNYVDDLASPGSNSSLNNTESHKPLANKWYSNLGYHHYGKFSFMDIIAIHPATREDPTNPGMYGTSSLRDSSDAFNEAITLSIVIKSRYYLQGFTSVDIECDSLELYYLLLRGFSLLKAEADSQRERDLSTQQSTMEVLQYLWKSTNKLVFTNHYAESNAQTDPITSLFDPNFKFDRVSAIKFALGKPSGTMMSNKLSGKERPAASASSIHSPNASYSKYNSVNYLPPAQFLGWSSAGTQIWARLKMAGLEVKCIYSWDLRKVLLKIKCPQWKLEEVAEHMHMKMKNKDGTLRRFKVSRRDTFVRKSGNLNDNVIFGSSERQQIIDFIIKSKIKDGGAELDTGSELGMHIIQRFPLHMYSRLNEIRHSWVTFWKKEAPGMYALPWSPFEVPFSVTMSRIILSLEHVFTGLLTQPLDNIAEYYGENVAFHYAYMAYYTRWLMVPSVLGLIVFIFQLHDRKLDHWLCLPYSIFIMIWASFMLTFWRQKSSQLAYRWGVLDYETEETERPQFYGNTIYDKSTGERRKVYPMWKRVVKYMISFPILLIMVGIMLVIMATIFTTQDHLFKAYNAGNKLNYYPSLSYSIGDYGNSHNTTAAARDNNPWTINITSSDVNSSDFWFVVFFYPCLYGILIDVFGLLFSKIALVLNNFENHRTQTSYVNRLILKVFSFRFVTVFTTLYYYAFYMIDKEAAYLRIAVTITCLMTVGQWTSAFLNICLPSILHKTLTYYTKINILKENRKIYKAKTYFDDYIDEKLAGKTELAYTLNNIINKRVMYLEQAKSKCWEESMLGNYDTFQDYTALVIQLGFVLLFSAVFPLAPLIAFINNIILIRLGAIKLCYTKQRPIATKASGIGVWEDVLQIMSVLGILTNCGIIGYTSTVLSTKLSFLSGAGIAVALFGFEHGILLFKYWLNVSIPRVPLSVIRAQTKERRDYSKSKSKGSKKKSIFNTPTHGDDNHYNGNNDDQYNGNNDDQYNDEQSYQDSLTPMSRRMTFDDQTYEEVKEDLVDGHDTIQPGTAEECDTELFDDEENYSSSSSSSSDDSDVELADDKNAADDAEAAELPWEVSFSKRIEGLIKRHDQQIQAEEQFKVMLPSIVASQTTERRDAAVKVNIPTVVRPSMKTLPAIDITSLAETNGLEDKLRIILKHVQLSPIGSNTPTKPKQSSIVKPKTTTQGPADTTPKGGRITKSVAADSSSSTATPLAQPTTAAAVTEASSNLSVTTPRKSVLKNSSTDQASNAPLSSSKKSNKSVKIILPGQAQHPGVTPTKAKQENTAALANTGKTTPVRTAGVAAKRSEGGGVEASSSSNPFSFIYNSEN